MVEHAKLYRISGTSARLYSLADGWVKLYQPGRAIPVGTFVAALAALRLLPDLDEAPLVQVPEGAFIREWHGHYGAHKVFLHRFRDVFLDGIRMPVRETVAMLHVSMAGKLNEGAEGHLVPLTHLLYKAGYAEGAQPVELIEEQLR